MYGHGHDEIFLVALLAVLKFIAPPESAFMYFVFHARGKTSFAELKQSLHFLYPKLTAVPFIYRSQRMPIEYQTILKRALIYGTLFRSIKNQLFPAEFALKKKE